MAWTYAYLTQAEMDQMFADRIRAIDTQRFDAAEMRKSIKARVGITEELRAAQMAVQTAIMQDMLAVKAATLASIGEPFDPQVWSYTANLTLNGVQYRVFRAADREERRLALLKGIENRYRQISLDVIRVQASTNPKLDEVLPSGLTRRATTIAQYNAELTSLEAEKAERIRDQSTPS